MIRTSRPEWESDRRYSRFDEVVLSQIPDDELERAIVGYVLMKLEGRSEKEEEILRGLPAGMQVVYHTWLLEAEVNNGGFNQYFWNSPGRFAQAALQGLRRLGAARHGAQWSRPSASSFERNSPASF